MDTTTYLVNAPVTRIAVTRVRGHLHQRDAVCGRAVAAASRSAG
ncbi:hypothetical protein [Kitasatospora nipponensis]